MSRMRKGLAALIAAFFFLGMGDKAQAVIGIPDDVPASTLLFPFFKVQTNRTSGDNQDTLLVVTNTAGTSATVHVTLWNIRSEHIYDFNVNLTPHDVFSCSLYDLLIGGAITGGTVCSNSSSGPGGVQPAPAGLETSFPYPASVVPAPGLIAGYVTIDVVTGNTFLFPGESNYPFSYRNILVGHQYLVNLPAGSSSGVNATSIESVFQCSFDGGHPARSIPFNVLGVNTGGFYRTRCEGFQAVANCAPSTFLLSCDGSSAPYGDLTERIDGPSGDFAQTLTAGGFVTDFPSSSTPPFQAEDSPLNLITRYFSADNLNASSEVWLWKDRNTSVPVNVAVYDEEENVHSIRLELPTEVNFARTAQLITPLAPGGWFRITFSCGQFGSCGYNYDSPGSTGVNPPLQALAYSVQFADSTGGGAPSSATLRWDAIFPAHRQYSNYIGSQ